MYKLKSNLLPQVFNNQFERPSHNYSTRFSGNNYCMKNSRSKTASFSIIYRGPYLWNNILTEDIKNSQTLNIFKTKLKQKLLDSEDEKNYF